MQFPKTKLMLLRGGIPPVKATKLTYYNDTRFMELAQLPAPMLPKRGLEEATAIAEASAARIEIAEKEARKRPIREDEVAATGLADEQLDPDTLLEVQSASTAIEAAEAIESAMNFA
jgi:type IV secretory pathway TraG/TraD family ATPase VirD4